MVYYLVHTHFMVHQVYLFIDSIHFGIAILCQDGWYKFEYAAGGASGLSGSSGSAGLFSKTTNTVTIKRSPPTGKKVHIGDTLKGLQEIIDFARVGSGFHNSDYGVTDNNCRIFCSKMASFMSVKGGYDQAASGYFFKG